MGSHGIRWARAIPPWKVENEMETKLIGHIGVDAGLCWIGDPCYVLPDDATENPGTDWMDFCAKIGSEPHTSFNYQLGHEGVGVCVSTGYGDGTYPVVARIGDDGRVQAVEVVFIVE